MTAGGISGRLAQIDWASVHASLDQYGYALTGAVLTAAECRALIALYGQRECFRSRIEMSRFRFGVGEYKYFAAPLPPLIQTLREGLYLRLAPIASAWVKALDGSAPFPPQLFSFLDRCHQAGQARPTPLLLRYEAGGYNCMHQDIYGEIVFPLQFTCVLSRREIDYRGGEFLLLEQRPRAQSSGQAITLEQGEAILFATRYRPVKGIRGYHRANIRHGVSRLHSGLRFSLGVIFHDAK